MSDPAALQVIILRDGLLVGTEAFIPGTFLIGSSAESDLKLDDPLIAGQHAILFFQNGRAAIQQSQGAVLVNGHPVRACEVRPVDEIALGPFTLKLRMLVKRAQAPKPAPSADIAGVLSGAPGPGSTRPDRPTLEPHPAPTRELPAAQSPVQPYAPAPVPPVPPVGNRYSTPSSLAQTAVARRGTPQPVPQAVATAPQPAPPRQPTAQPVARPGQPAARPSAGPRPVAKQGPAPQPTARQAPAAQPIANPAAAPQALSRSSAPQASARPSAPQPSAAPPAARQPAPMGTQLFGHGADSAAPALDALDLLADDDRTSPAFAPVPAIEPTTVPSARRVGNAVVATAPAPSLETAPLRAVPNDTAPFAPRPFRVPTQGRRGKPRLYLELFWGEAAQASHCVRPGKKPFTLGEKRKDFELWGFATPEAFTLAETEGNKFRVFTPPGARVERLHKDGTFSTEGGRADAPSVTLQLGEAVRFVSGPMRLRAYVAPPPERFFGNPLKNVPWLALALVLLFGGGLLSFALHHPAELDAPDFNPQDLAPVAVKLLRPQKPKKKKPERVRAEKKEKPREEPKKVAENKPKPKPVVRHEPKPQPKVEEPPAPEVKALKALAKLSAAGPAMHDMLAAVDKLGNGPGSKHVKTVSYKLSGLVGKKPIASAGLGTFGLGGGGKGGIGTLGAELLHGKGGGGIGAMGAGSVGHGRIGGRVSHASARTIAARGNIDRAAVARVVNQHLAEVHSCYERQLLKEPSLAGKVVLEWTLSTSGRVVEARTRSSTLHNPSVESCILASLKTWHFPSARGGSVIISYPFLFNAVGY